jgi:hypothetical protein
MTTIALKKSVQAAPESEGAWAARLMRQRQIIKAYHEKRCAASEAGPLPEELAKAA